MPIDTNIPVVSEEEAERMEQRREHLINDLRSLRDAAPLLTNEEYSNLQRELDAKTLECASLRGERGKLYDSIVALNGKIENYNIKYTYPNDCTRNCVLRKTFSGVIESVRIDRANKQKSYDELGARLEPLVKRTHEISDTLVPQRAARPILNNLEAFISSKHWGEYVCSGLTVLEAINNDITKMINNYSKIIYQAKRHAIVKRATETLTTLEAKLAGLKSSDKPVKEYLTRSLIDKERQLKRVDAELTRLDNLAKEVDADLVMYRRHKSLCERVHKLKAMYDLWKRKYIATMEHRCITESIEYLQGVKTQIDEKLRELDSIVSEQNGYLTRLRDEIEPSIQELTNKLNKLTAVAEQLSPTSGIPYKYTVRYVNVLFQIANTFIRRVWNYDIELAYIDENKKNEFDFTFQLLVNRSSVVKDIRLCSKSQKSIVNLAIRLAICVYRGYIGDFPIKLDEIDDGFSPLHQEKLTEFLIELLNQNNILQGFVVHQSISVSSSFTNAGVIVLAGSETLPENCVIKSKVS